MVRRINTVLGREYKHKGFESLSGAPYHTFRSKKRGLTLVRSIEGRTVCVALSKNVSLGTYSDVMDILGTNTSIYNHDPNVVVLEKTI